MSTVTKDAAADAPTEAQDAGAGIDLDEFNWRALFTYRTARSVNVAVWQLGLAYRIVQFGLFAYVLYTLLWAH